jgi:chemotaxis protein MotB
MRAPMVKRFVVVTTALAWLTGCGVPEEQHKAALQDLDETRAELARVQKEKSSADAEIARLEKKVEELQAKIAKLEKSRDRLENELVEARKTLALVESETGGLQEALEATREELDKLREQKAQQEARLQQYRDVASKLQSMIEAGQLKVKLRDGKMVIELADNILFDPGKTEIKKGGKEALQGVAEVLKSIENRDFLVAGHTDNVPTSASRFDSNWELSTERAVEVVKLLQNAGVDPKKLAAAGFGEYDPIASNETEETRALNRRIEIILMPNIQEIPSLPDDLLDGKSSDDKSSAGGSDSTSSGES